MEADWFFSITIPNLKLYKRAIEKNQDGTGKKKKTF